MVRDAGLILSFSDSLKTSVLELFFLFGAIFLDNFTNFRDQNIVFFVVAFIGTVFKFRYNVTKIPTMQS